MPAVLPTCSSRFSQFPSLLPCSLRVSDLVVLSFFLVMSTPSLLHKSLCCPFAKIMPPSRRHHNASRLYGALGGCKLNILQLLWATYKQDMHPQSLGIPPIICFSSDSQDPPLLSTGLPPAVLHPHHRCSWMWDHQLRWH